MKKNMLKNFTRLEDFISEELKSDLEFSIEYEKQTIIHEIAKIILEIRKSCHLTQIELAEKVGTTLPIIASLESGNDSQLPSFELLSKIAHASNYKLSISFTKVAMGGLEPPTSAL